MAPSWSLSVTGRYNYSLGAAIPHTEDVQHSGTLYTKCLVLLSHHDKQNCPCVFSNACHVAVRLLLRTTVASAYQMTTELLNFYALCIL